jgi:hypothetical protein
MATGPFFGVMALLNMAPSAFALGDAALVPASPKHRIRSLSGLRKEVVCWSQQYNPALSRQDVDAVVGWLNKNFYKLDK